MNHFFFSVPFKVFERCSYTPKAALIGLKYNKNSNIVTNKIAIFYLNIF